MSAPILGNREEPLGAASEDLSDEENGWGSEFGEEDEDDRSFDYDEEGEGIYDMPEYLPEGSTQEIADDESREGIYDVPEFLPEEAVTSQRPNAPLIPRDKKPTVLPPQHDRRDSGCQRTEPGNHIEEDYLAPKELTCQKSSPVPRRPLDRPVRNGLREALPSHEGGARGEENTAAPAIPSKPGTVPSNQLGKPMHTRGADQTIPEQVFPNITGRKPAQPVPQRPKPGLKPNLRGKSLEKDASKPPETVNSLNWDSKDHESAVGSPSGKENSRADNQMALPRPGPRPQKNTSPPSAPDDFYELATNDSKPNDCLDRSTMPPPNRGVKPLIQKRDVSVPLANSAVSDDVYEVADDTKPKINSRQPKMPPPILGKKPSNRNKNIAAPLANSAVSDDVYEFADDGKPKIASRLQKMPPPIPGSGKPSKSPLGTTRSPRESVKRFEPEADPMGGENTDVYEIADRALSTGQAENVRPQLPIPTKDTTKVSTEESLPPRPSKFSLFQNTREKPPPMLPSASSVDPPDLRHGQTTPYSPPRQPSVDTTENYEVMQGVPTYPSSPPHEEQEAYESMNNADPSFKGNGDLGSFACDRILESNKFSGVNRNHFNKGPLPKLSGKRESLRSNVSGRDTYEVTGGNQQLADHNQNHTVEQETYEVVTDNKSLPKPEPEMYEVPNESGQKPKPLKRPPPLQSRKESVGFSSETSFDSEDDYITPINGPQEKGPITCVRDKPRPPIVPRDANPGEIKRDDSSSGKSSSLKEKLKAPGDRGVVKKLQMQIGDILTRDMQSQKFSTGSSKKTQPEKPAIPVRQDHVKEENEPMISLEDLQRISISGKPAPIMPNRISRPPTKPGRNLSQSESMQEVMNYSEWYHGSLTRVEAERKLTTHRKEGMFIVRDTEKGHGYSLSFYADGAVRHLRINHHSDSSKYNLGSYAQKFNSVVELIQHFQDNAFEVKKREGSNSRGGGLARLTLPCPK